MVIPKDSSTSSAEIGPEAKEAGHILRSSLELKDFSCATSPFMMPSEGRRLTDSVLDVVYQFPWSCYRQDKATVSQRMFEHSPTWLVQMMKPTRLKFRFTNIRVHDGQQTPVWPSLVFMSLLRNHNSKQLAVSEALFARPCNALVCPQSTIS